MRTIRILLTLAFMGVVAATVYGRGGGRGGGGGGGARGGGGGGFSGGGGGARPSPSMNRSPSMSRPPSPSPRPQQQAARPSPSASRPQAGTGARPSTGNLGATNRAASPSTGRAANSAGNFNRPSQNQVNDFLGMKDSGRPSSFNAPSNASQLQGSGGNSKSYTTERGTTITVGGASGSGTTAGGATVGGAAGGVKIEGAGGQTYAKGSGAIGATDGTNSAVRGGSATGIQNAAGESAVNVRGGYADTSGNRAVRSATAVQGKYGNTAANVRGGYATAAGAAGIASASAIRGPAGNVVTAGRGAAFQNGQFIGGQSWQAVNGNFTHWNCYTPGWVGNYPNCWWPGKWAVATTAWATATWATAGSYCGCEGEPAYYDYGENVTYEDGTVYSGEEPLATEEQYYDQASQIAAEGEGASNEEWLPLGVFAVIAEEGQTKTDKVVQLALNKEGTIRGNFHDVLTDKVAAVSGSVDKETQRVAVKIEGNDNVVVETGLYNLTNDEVPVLVHFDASRREPRTLIRLKQPEEEGK